MKVENNKFRQYLSSNDDPKDPAMIRNTRLSKNLAKDDRGKETIAFMTPPGTSNNSII